MRYTLLLLALTACTPAPRYVVCTVDDTISFTADNARSLRTDGPTLIIHRDGPNIVRNMLPGETCERANVIDWP